MSHVSDASLYDTMSQSDLIQQMKKIMSVLEKKEKTTAKVLVKAEVKKAAAAPLKGVRPVQLEKNAAWVEYVHQTILSTGWEAFIHAERSGKGMADIEYPASALAAIRGQDGQPDRNETNEIMYAYVFDGSVSESSPNGHQPNMSHAMTLSKLYKVKKPELYSDFESEYVAPPPGEGSSILPIKPVRLSMTLEEKLREKLEKEQEKIKEREEKKTLKLMEREEKKALKEEEKRMKAMEKELAKSSKLPKGAVKAVIRPIPVKAVVPKPVARPVKKQEWTPPAKGDTKRVVVLGIAYYADYLNRVFVPDENDMPSDCVGVYVPATHSISDDDVPEDE